MEKKARGGFTSNIGFILAAAGSAIGLGNLWRFPYLAAKNGGGLFLVVYIILALTFGFTMMATEIAIGRKTGVAPLEAYGKMHKKFGFLGWITSIVPALIFPYYCVIGGWVTKYGFTYATGGADRLYEAGASDFFSEFIGEPTAIIWFLIFMVISAVVVFLGVEKGVERASKIMMPALFVIIIGISVYSLTLSHTDENGVTRTALEGLKIYLIPNFEGLTVSKFFTVLLDAVTQLFYSLSIAMGILITYGSYSSKESNLLQSVNRIEIFDTGVALLAGLIIIPTVFAFQGSDGLTAAGPGLMFISLPNVFQQMDFMGNIVGALFFILVFFAAITSSISLMETVVSCIIDRFKTKRSTATLITLAVSVIIGGVVCLGYSVLYCEVDLPNGTQNQQILDIVDYVTNSIMLPIVALITCILVGWVVKPSYVTEELMIGCEGKAFRREGLYIVMIKYIAPIFLVLILLQSFNLFSFLG